MRPIRYFAALALLAASVAASHAAPPPSSLLHKPAPPFVRQDLGNHRISLASYRGHVVLLNFWATWCVPCRLEIPKFVQWQTQYGKSGLQIVGVSMEDDPAPVFSFLRKKPVNYPVLMGDAKLGELYGGVLGLPVTFLIDRHGNIADRFQGEADLRRMQSEIEALLNAR